MKNYTQQLDGITFELKEPFDFGFVEKYGRVYKAFDQQDSGNICFGVDGEGGKMFIKFAGAPTKRAVISPQEAIRNLKATVPLYRDLAHEHLVKLLAAEDIGGGFAMIFEWSDAKCMGRMYPESHARFIQASQEEKLDVFEAVQCFLQHVHEKGYVAIDFYDGSIMYDFTAKKTVICDIDFFCPKPRINDMGRMWGSSRFMSPEEYILGAELDEVTNVYTLGAMAFALFADCQRTREQWSLNDAAFGVAKKAISDERSQRYHSIDEFIWQWQAAVKE